MKWQWSVLLNFGLVLLFGGFVVREPTPAVGHSIAPVRQADPLTPTPALTETLVLPAQLPPFGIQPSGCCGEASIPYLFRNEWRGIRHGYVVDVLAGARKGVDLLDTVVGINIWTDGHWHHDSFQVWPTPQKVGCVQVVAVRGPLATLQSCNPQLPAIQFVFDLDRHVWVSPNSPLYPPSRATPPPRLQPGGQIAYVEDEELWLLNLDTGHRVQLTATRDASSPALTNAFPQWTADGQYLINWRDWVHTKGGPSDLVRLDLATGWDTRISDLDTPGQDRWGLPFLPTRYAPISGVPGPSGLALNLGHEARGTRPDTLVWRAADKRETVLYQAPVGCNLTRGTASDDGQFVFLWGSGQCSSLLLARTDQGYEVRPTDIPMTGCGTGAWGTHRHVLAYTTTCAADGASVAPPYVTPGTQIQVLDLDQAHPQSKLIYTGAEITALAWSPNDSWLAFATSDGQHQPNGLWILAGQGGIPQKMAARGTGPAWRPERSEGLPGAGHPRDLAMGGWFLLSVGLGLSGSLLRGIIRIQHARAGRRAM